MGIFTDIQAALDSHLEDAPTSITITYENVPFSPTAATSFIRPTTLYAGSNIETMARIDSFSGIYQIDVFTELEKGPAALNTALEALHGHFIDAKTLVAGAHEIFIRSINRLPGERDGSWYRGSIEVGFMVYTI